MIKDNDIDFHTPDDADHTWCETQYFCVTVPEERIMATFYMVFRKGLGVMLSDIIIVGGTSESRAETLYIDSQQHLPAPEKLSDYTTANGFSCKSLSPRDYDISYKGFDETEAQLSFRGLMEPFDINDPEHSPKAEPNPERRSETSGQGEAYSNHFDLTGRVTGKLCVRGKWYDIDCIETMDHSWGRRPEVGLRSLGWMHAHFNENFAIHWINHYDLEKPTDEKAHGLAHGYVMENGEAYGLTNLTLSSVRNGTLPVTMTVTATDIRGKTWNLHGAAELAAPWTPYTCVMLSVAMMRWTLPDGQVGYGMAQEVYPMDVITRQRHRHWNDVAAHITT